jgi:hypothetical protein
MHLRRRASSVPLVPDSQRERLDRAESAVVTHRTPVTRTRRSARQAGTRFERQVADHLAQALDDDRIERRARTGAHDRGDIGGLRIHGGQRVVIECKDCTKLDLPAWTRQAQLEAGNDGALVGLVIHKRHGRGDPGSQWVSLTVDDLVAILTGQPAEQ